MACTTGARCFVWTLWVINTIVSSVYLGISMVTFHNIKNGVKYLSDFPNREAYKNGLLAACMLGFLIVIFWVIFSFFILVGRLFSTLPLAYGVMLGTCTHTGFFMLLSGLVLQTHENLATNFKNAKIWSASDYQTYVATFSFSYILCGTYLIMFLVLLFTAGSMTSPKDRSDSYVAKTPSAAPATPPAATGTVSGIESNHGFGANWSNSYRGGNV